MKRRTFLKVFGAALPIAVVSGAGCLSARGAASAKGENLRILSCNIRVDVPADSKTGDGWAHRKAFCADVIVSRKPDIIGFQEAQVPHYEYLKSRFPEFATYGLFNPGKIAQPSNVIFYARSRFELVSSGGFWLSETPHIAGSKSWDSANVRFVNWVDLLDRAGGKQLRFWNTHLDHIGQRARENGASMIVEACKPLPPNLPQIITGDFNAGATNKAITIMKEGQWIDTYTAVHGPAEPGFTAHAFKGVNAPTLRKDNQAREKIDWVFCRGPVRPVAASIIRDSRDGHWPSDHFFVSADVSL